MDFDPPIASRTTEELIEIANFPEDWNPLAVEQAQQELTNRGVTHKQQQKQLAEWKKQFQDELETEMAERAIESYGLFTLFWMAFKWPYTILGDWRLKKEGYLRKHKERLYSIGIGILTWIILFTWILGEYERSELERINGINQQDIYEWEKNNFTDEEMIDFRKSQIQQLIETVQTNKTKGTPTYVILEQDTIPNSEVEQLRNLDMSNIRDVVFQGDFEPEYHEWITIKLLKPADNKR
ncbi:MAG: hypothetical protein RIE55_00475 [Marinoscillum sp.]